eukprot:scaffold3044_cov176-Ochromonas_danica.AAC.29
MSFSQPSRQLVGKRTWTAVDDHADDRQKTDPEAGYFAAMVSTNHWILRLRPSSVKAQHMVSTVVTKSSLKFRNRVNEMRRDHI